MCKYCNTKNYKKIYINHYGNIPKDEEGRSYDIHHIDGNHDNNDPSNLIALSIEEHYNAHYLNEDWNACILISLRMKIPPPDFAEVMSRAQKGKMTVIEHETGKFKRIDVNDPFRNTDKYSSVIKNKTITKQLSTGEIFWLDVSDKKLQESDYVGICKGKCPAIVVKTGEIIQVELTDSRWKTGEIVGNRKGYTLVLDTSSNKCISVHKDDIRLKSGELISIRKGKCNGIDTLTGKKIETNPFDERWKTGEIVGLSKGLSSVKNIKTGETKYLTIEEKKLLDDDWVSANKGCPQQKITCIWCGKIGGIGNMNRYHFDNCKLNPINNHS